jgi:hypothetical protein
MITKFIEAKSDGGNWGKFMVARFTPQEWNQRSALLAEHRGTAWNDTPSLLSTVGWGRQHVLVMDLQTGEGAVFRPGGHAGSDLNKHAVWVCPLFEPFLEWLYKKDLTRLSDLPDLVDLKGAEFSYAGHRRPGPSDEEKKKTTDTTKQDTQRQEK